MKRFGEKIYITGNYNTIFSMFQKTILNDLEFEKKDFEYFLLYTNTKHNVILIKEDINTTKLKKTLLELCIDINNTFILKPDHIKTMFLKSFNISSNKIFTFSEVLMNIKNHKTQPLEINIVNEEKKQKILAMYNIKIENLPKINASDIICKYYNIKPYDMIEIIRNEGYYYRLCI